MINQLMLLRYIKIKSTTELLSILTGFAFFILGDSICKYRNFVYEEAQLLFLQVNFLLM